jgi:hypothetical protein
MPEGPRAQPEDQEGDNYAQQQQDEMEWAITFELESTMMRFNLITKASSAICRW